MVTVEASSHRVLTVPNVITLVRLGCIPVFLWLLFVRDNHVAAAFLLAVLGATDWVDGYIARRFNQVSDLGKVLDPVADRVLFIVCVTALIVDDAVPQWFGIVVVVREVLVGGTAVVLTALGMKRIDVTWWGKAGTFGLMVAFPLFLVGHSTAGWHRAGGDLAWIAAVPGMVLGLYSLFVYLPLARRAIAGPPAPETKLGVGS